MKREVQILFLVFLIICLNCVTFVGLSEKDLPLTTRLLSNNNEVKEKAINEFFLLNENEKNNIKIQILNILSNEKNEEKQKNILKILEKLKLDDYLIVDFFNALEKNENIKIYADIYQFLENLNLNNIENLLLNLVKFLKSEKWEIRKSVLLLIKNNANKAKILIPEIINTIDIFGKDEGKYNFIFDILSMVEPEISITKLLLDIKNKNDKIKKNAIKKIVELNSYLASEIKAKKEITFGLLKLFLSDNKIIFDIIKQEYNKIDDREIKNKIEEYIKLSESITSGISKILNTDKIFLTWEEKLKERLKKYLEKIGRKEEIEKLLENYN